MKNKPKKNHIILHIGAPKTGTTTLQAVLFSLTDSLREQGFLYMQRRPYKTEEYLFHAAVVLSKQNKMRGAQNRADACLKEAFADPTIHTAIISNEGMLAEVKIEGTDGLFPLAEQQLDNLFLLCGEATFDLRLMIRCHSQFIPSYYTQRVRQGLSLSIEDYMASLEKTDLSWANFCDRLIARSKGTGLTVQPFETFKNDPLEAIRTLLPELKDTVTDQTVGRNNQSPSARALRAMVWINGFFESRYGAAKTVGKDRRLKIQRFLRKAIFPALEFILRGEKLRLPADVTAKLDALYAEDLRRLGLD